MGALIRDLGGSTGFGFAVDRGDDGVFQSAETGGVISIDLSRVFPSGIRFGSKYYTSASIGLNGVVGFYSETNLPSPGSALGDSSYSFVAGVPTVFALWADLDTSEDASGRPSSLDGTNQLYYSLEHGAFTFTLDYVGRFGATGQPGNAVQVQLTPVGNAGDFNVQFNIESVSWAFDSYSIGISDGVQPAHTVFIDDPTDTHFLQADEQGREAVGREDRVERFRR